MPFRFEAAILSRIRSPVTSRSNWAKDNSTLRVSRPIEVVVLNCCVTETNDTPLASKISNDLGEIRQRAGQPVNLVDDHDVDLALADLGKQELQGGPLQIAPRAPAIVIGLRQAGPALMTLAHDERLAGFALRMQRVELLLQPLFGGFAGIDGAAQRAPGPARRLTHRRLRPPRAVAC